MSRITEITDIADPALDMYARLTERQLHPKHARGYFIAESRTVVTLALAAGIEPVSFLMDKSQLSGASADLAREILADRWGDVPLYTAEDRVLESLTGFALSRGVLAVMRRPILPTVGEVCRGARRIAVLEDIMDSSNVGAIIRSAAAGSAFPSSARRRTASRYSSEMLFAASMIRIGSSRKIMLPSGR